MEQRLDHAGRTLTVRAEREGRFSTAVTAFADDEELGTDVQDGIKPVRIPVDDTWTIEADSLIPGRLRRCELKRDDEAEAVPFPPPDGTLAARAYAHPRLWAARHVVVGVAQVLLAIFGVSLVVRGLIPNIDIPVPDVDLPDIPFPDLFGWLPDIEIPRPDLPNLPDLHTKYWLPVVIAVGVAVGEHRKRRRRQEAGRQDDEATRDGD